MSSYPAVRSFSKRRWRSRERAAWRSINSRSSAMVRADTWHDLVGRALRQSLYNAYVVGTTLASWSYYDDKTMSRLYDQAMPRIARTDTWHDLVYRVTSLIRNRHPVGPIPWLLWCS